MADQKRTKHGYLIMGDLYVLPAQERARRWCFRGAVLGFATFVVSTSYVLFKYGKSTGIAGYQARFASWDVMPSEVQVLLVVEIAAWAMGFFSMLTLFLLNRSIAQQLLEELGEEG